MHSVSKVERCRVCRTGRMSERTENSTFTVNGAEVVVPLLVNVCTSCGARLTTGTQRLENQRRLKARKAHYGKALMGEEVLAIRRKYGITQQQAGKLFGKGKIAFSRYESETTRPDITTNKLMRLAAEKADVMKWLADDEALDIPLVNLRLHEQNVGLIPLSWIKQYEVGAALQRTSATAVVLGGEAINHAPLPRYGSFDSIGRFRNSVVIAARTYDSSFDAYSGAWTIDAEVVPDRERTV